MTSVADKIRALRDGGRPTLNMVVETLDRLFRGMSPEAEVVCIERGPTTWVWKDATMCERRLDKYYILTTSLAPETVGHPLFTIRQAYSLYMDSWITSSSLVIARTESEIARVISVMIANHLGCFSGFRYAMNSVVAEGGNPAAGLAAGRALMDAAERRLTLPPDDDDAPAAEPDLSSRTDLN